MATNVAIARRRARLTGRFVPQVAAAVPRSEDHAIAEVRWFPVREPVSGNRYAMVRVKTRSGLTGWGECAQASEQDAAALEKTWIGGSYLSRKNIILNRLQRRNKRAEPTIPTRDAWLRN